MGFLSRLCVAAILLLMIAPVSADADIQLLAPAPGIDHPSLAVGSDGLLRMVWREPVAGVGQIHWASFTAGGELVDGPVQVTSDPYGCATPRLDLDGRDHSHIVWQSGLGAGTLFFARVAADGNIELAPRSISLGGGDYANPDIATDKGSNRSHVASYYEPVSQFYIEYVLVDDQGSVLKRDIPGNDDIIRYRNKRPAIALGPGGVATVVYQDYAGTFVPSSGFWRARYDASGNRIARAKIATTEHAYPIDLFVSGAGQEWIFYHKSSRIYRLSGGTSIQTSPPPGPSRWPRVAAADGHSLFLVWEESSAPAKRIVAQQWTLDGTLVAESVDVSNSTGEASLPDIATDGAGRYYVVWLDSRHGDPSVYLGKLPPHGIDVHVQSAVSEHPVPQAEVLLLVDGVTIEESESGVEGISPFRGHEIDEAVILASFQGRSTNLPTHVLFPKDRVDSVAVDVPTILEVYGRIQDEHNGVGVPGYRVQLVDDTQQVVFDTESRRDGGFSLYGEDPGLYEVRMTKRAAVGTGGMQPLYPDTIVTGIDLSLASPTFDLGTFDLPSQLVVMVHGIKSSSAVWRDSGFADSLRNRGWTVLDDLDLPGQVLTLPWHGMAPIDEQARHLQRVTEAYDAPNFQVVAHSQGGLVTRFMVERLESGKTPRVQRLVTLGTPHHGSPLATSISGILWLLGSSVPTGWRSLGSPLLKRTVEEAYPAFVDLKPNSDFLSLLNQGDKNAGDWSGFCVDNPESELGLRPEVAYLAVAGTDHSGWYEGGNFFLAVPWACGINDGIVPTTSALLQGPSAGVLKQGLWPGVHHKAASGIYVESDLGSPVVNRRAATPSIYADPNLQSYVAHHLETAPEDWQGLPRSMESAASASGSWSSLGLLDLWVDASGSGSTALEVDSADTLRITWSWFEGDVDLSLLPPSGVPIDSQSAVLDPAVDYLRIPGESVGLYEIVAPEAGSWTLEATPTGATEGQNVVIWASAAGAADLAVAITNPTGETFAQRLVEAALTDAVGQPLLGATVSADVTLASGATNALSLVDDGLGSDASANDGIYSAWVAVEATPGITVLDVLASGGPPAAFQRRALETIRVGRVTDLQIGAPGLDGASRTGLLGSRIHLEATIVNAGDVAVSLEASLFRDDETLRVSTDTLTVAAQSSVTFESSYMPLQTGTPNFRLVVAPLDAAEANWSDNTSVMLTDVGPAVTGIGGSGSTEGSIPPHARNRSVTILTSYPNPFNPTISVEFALRAAGRVQLQIHDLRGRRVSSRPLGLHPSGVHTVRWDGTDDRGRSVASGVYLISLTTAGETTTKKVALVR